MPRPRATSTETILDAAARVISRVGPARLTLADVAAEAGLAAPTLIQRFGSKRGLLLAVARQGAFDVAEAFVAAREAQTSPLEALVDALSTVPEYVGTPEELSNHLAFLHLGLADPEFHEVALEHANRMRGHIARLLDEATGAGELAHPDVDGLSRTVQTTCNGALVTWALYRIGALGTWLRGEIEEVLEPYRPD